MVRAVARRTVLIALVGLALGSPGTAAQPAAPAEGRAPAAPAVETSTRAGLVLDTDLRDAHVAGRALLVTLRARNPTEAALSFPNLEARPHLVRFELTPEKGRVQVRYTTPPAEDEEDRWVIPPGATRQTTLEIPSGAALAAARYTLAVKLQDGEEALALGPFALRIEAARPATVSLGDETDGVGSADWMVPWVQQGAGGNDLYLDTRDAGAPSSAGWSWPIARLSEPATPWLSAARPADVANRYLVWREGARGLTVARIEDRRLRRQPRRVGLPYPAWEILARGGMDAQAGLCVPIWTAAPAGSAGDVRLACVSSRGEPAFRTVTRLPERPGTAATWVDAAGQLRLLLLHAGKLDLYTLETGASPELPPAGRRLLPQVVRAAPASADPVAASGAGRSARGGLIATIGGFVPARLGGFEAPQLAGARFAPLPDRAEQPGGTMIFGWSTVAARGASLVTGTWLSLEGRVVAAVQGTALPAGHRIAAVHPRGYDPLVLISEDAEGVGWASSADWSRRQQLGQVGPGSGYRRDAEGGLWLLRAVDGRGLVATPVREPAN